jgi:ferrous iron transport protein B
VTPLFSPLGIHPDNWAATVGIATGIFAKEAVVGTLNSLYQNQRAADKPADFDLTDAVIQAVSTIPANLAAINPWDPAGLKLGNLQDQHAMADEAKVDLSTFGNMQSHFDGQIGAFAYLLFILLYMPCAAAMGALAREAGRNWAVFTALWCNLMAFMVSTLYYQLATFMQHPAQSLGWVGFYLLLALLLGWGMRRKGDILANRVVRV